MPVADLGSLYLVPAPLDFGCDSQAALADVMPQATLARAAQLRHWICENAKSTRAYLQRIHATHPLALPLREQQIVVLPREVHKNVFTPRSMDARTPCSSMP